MSLPSARAEASLWIVRLHGPQRTPALEAGFQEWLAADPENAREFERVNDVWDSVTGLANSGIPRVARWGSLPRTFSPVRLSFAKAAAVLLTIGALALVGWLLLGAPDRTYATSVGEQRTFSLDDGTRVSLNSRSRLAVVYDASKREVHLENGEAYFEVARDPARPFTVVAGEQRVRALGTAFLVQYESARVSVALVEGKVSVAGGASSPKVLEPGERLTVVAHQTPTRDKPRMEVVTAWRRGEVILDRTPLAEAIAEMSRYSRTALVVEDQTLAGLRISGVYKAGDSASFALATAKMLGLSTSREGDRIVLRRENP